MTNFEISQLVVQTAGAAGLFLTLYVYYRQLNTMSHQLEASRKASTAQNIVALINFLQTPEVRASRECVRTRLKDKPFVEWTDEDRSHVSRVCANYDIAAVILRLGMVPAEPFLLNWGHSIRHCFDVAKPLIDEMQLPENSGSTYWANFGWMRQQAELSRTGSDA